VPDGELASEADALLDGLATGPTASYAGWKRLVNRRAFTGLAEQLDAEADAQGEQGRTEDFVEGVLAFVQKRPPDFKGR
jgi:2-(1,2-epoxy-1,2-dihydrophenyl)acetyl-CoA isomerase